ncbi:chromosome partitioning protein ParA [Yersinia enterocolitica]
MDNKNMENTALLQKQQELNNREQALAASERALKADKEAIEKALADIAAEKIALRHRERAVENAERTRDQGYIDERRVHDDEFFTLRRKQQEELEANRVAAYQTLDKQISQQWHSRLAELERDIAAKKKASEEALQQERDRLDEEQRTLKLMREELETLKDDTEFEKKRAQLAKDKFTEREAWLDSEVEAKIGEWKRLVEIENARLTTHITSLYESVQNSNALLDNFNELKRRLGDEDPAVVLLKLRTYEEEVRDLRHELAVRPTKEMQEAFDRLKGEHEKTGRVLEEYKEKLQALRDANKDPEELEYENERLKRDNKRLAEQRDNADARGNELLSELQRFQISYQREAERDKRIQFIEKPHFETHPGFRSDDRDELQWLDEIKNACEGYGLKFPRRILHAFHTALKTAELSPMTVLAGVSGTGKSELPKLYSHFGGINFLSLAVQPNWDSQESMLGFFNAIDNQFDAQPVLRLLAQSQKARTEDYPGMRDAINLVLMDEMNLAHVELYFAEFLSKLELRRGMTDTPPHLDIKLGAGIDAYSLPLGRNVLWVGTMNQDETTKSLSDKVLDRGFVINFPRPTTLASRPTLQPLKAPPLLLPHTTWDRWCSRESLFDEREIEPYRTFIERINAALANVGRALGHRVWQSIEYYMSNYPDVRDAKLNHDDAGQRKAMRTAFEDQLVQKVMPKLRGIETRGKSRTECLDKILALLDSSDYKIGKDFELACEFGYGQFIWNSANYLEESDSVANDPDASNANKDKDRLNATRN